MPDSRIKDLIDEYHTCFVVKYKVTPMIGGQTAKLSQQLWIWADQNKVEEARIYSALMNFFSDDAFALTTKHDFGLFYKKIATYLEPPKKTAEQIGLENIEKARKMFEVGKERMDTALKVDEKSPKDFIDYFTKTFSKDQFGCELWVKKQRFMMGISDSMKDKESKIYALWVKEGKAAREYFGNELIAQCWREPEKVAKPKLSEQLKKAKELEQNG